MPYICVMSVVMITLTCVFHMISRANMIIEGVWETNNNIRYEFLCLASASYGDCDVDILQDYSEA